MSQGIPMDKHLDYQIKLSTDGKYKSLYPWSLQEFDDNGKQIGRDQAPWQWDLYFESKNIKFGNATTLESDFLQDVVGDWYETEDLNRRDVQNRYQENLEVTQQEYVSCELVPSSKEAVDTKFYMFGTNRPILDITLSIGKSDVETCRVFGAVSSTFEHDFRDLTNDDSISIGVHIKPEKFDKIVELAKTKKIDQIEVSIGEVRGFYSDWSPSISTHSVKVLTKSDHDIEKPENCTINPPRLGYAGKISIQVSSLTEISVDTDEYLDQDDGALDNNSEHPANSADEKLNSQKKLSDQIIELQKNIRGLRVPLWGIFFLLLVITLFNAT